METRYFRTDKHTVNGLTEYKLGLEQSTDRIYTPEEFFAGNVTLEYGINVWVIHVDGTATLLTDVIYVIGSRSTDGHGVQSKAWSCPETALEPTDAIMFSFYIRRAGRSWFFQARFITEQLGATKLNAATWTIYIWTDRLYDEVMNDTSGMFRFGRDTDESKVENFTWEPLRVLTLTLSVDKRWIRMGETVTFAGRLTENGVGVPGETVHVGFGYAGKWNWIPPTDTTDSRGYYSISWTPGFGEILSCIDYEWIAYCIGIYSPTTMCAIAYPTRIRGLYAPSEVQPGDRFVVRGYLEHQVGVGAWDPIGGATVSIYYNGVLLGKPVTESDGYFSLTASIPETDTYTLRASYAGSEIPGYAPAEAEIKSPAWALQAQLMDCAMLIGALAPIICVSGVLVGNEILKMGG